MGRTTGIEWTDATWNPIRGCSRVSEGCRNCYAETVANRFGGPGKPYEGLVQLGADGKGNGKWNGQIAFVEKHLLDPLRMKTPSRIFVNSMSDLFHEGVTDEMLDRIFAVMALCPQHTFQVLTKRPERMLAYLTSSKVRDDVTVAAECEGFYSEFVDARMPINADNLVTWPLPNVWLGVSVENQKAADERIPLLLQTPAAVRFLSVEPMLGAVQLDDIVVPQRGHDWHFSALGDDGDVRDDPDFHGASINWVICGGESGPGARPMHPDWARSLRDQCVAAGVPFFFKQWGEWLPQTGGIEQLKSLPPTTPCTLLALDGHRGQSIAEMEGHARFGRMLRVGKKAAGRLLDGREWSEMPEVAR